MQYNRALLPLIPLPRRPDVPLIFNALAQKASTRNLNMGQGRYADSFAHPNGPGDARPTALQIVKDEGMGGALSGKAILITGASSGLGKETARALYATGAKLYLGVRDVAKGKEVADEIAKASRGGEIEVINLDLGSIASVKAAAKQYLSKTDKLNILVNNAGVMAAPEGMKTQDGFDLQFGTNHLGHFLLFDLLKPALLAASTPAFQSRVVCLSSLGHRSSPICFDDLNQDKKPYNKWTAYGQSKTANIYLANEIERRYGSQGLHATSVEPGGILTNLLRHIVSNPQDMELSAEIRSRLKSPEQGAACTVWAAIGKEWEGKGGRYLEKCAIAQPVDPTIKDLQPTDPGYKSYAYDEEAAKKLWEVSEQLIASKAV